MVAAQFGLLTILLSGIMVTMAGLFAVISYFSDHAVDWAAVIALLLCGVSGLLFGGALWYYCRRGPKFIGRREALLLVALSWLLGAAVAAVPFWAWAHFHFPMGVTHPFHSFIACYFESMSGLTTTGATVLTDIEGMPRSLLLWRAVTHWLGGLGIVVLFVAVLPGLGVGGKKLFQVESPGPAPEGLQPHIRETARWLWYIYLGFTVVEIIALMTIADMGPLDAICHAFATLSTGGFSTKNASVGAFYATPTVDMIVIVFMVLAGVNFGLYYRLGRGKITDLLADTELRLYLGLILFGTLAITAALVIAGTPISLLGRESGLEPTFVESARQALFTTVAVHTTTGFCTADFNLWPFFAKAILVAFMFVGGSSGSTAGGIKIIRIWIVVKILLAEVEHVFRPHVVRPVRVGSGTIDPELRLGALAYVVGILVLFALGAIAVKLCGGKPGYDCDVITAATASAATLFNIGPGLGLVGASGNYGWFSETSMAVMALLMALGRLEVFAIIVLFSPRFWRRD
jgi:trk system potassium uptake protein TrkH